MARASESRPLYSDDSDPDTDPETPRPPTRQTVRKRKSEVHTSPNDSNDSDSGPPRVPFKSVNINDDAAEKRRRRKSTKFAVAEESSITGPSSGADASMDDPDSSRSMRQKQQQLNAIAPPTNPIAPSIDILSSKFEEWMKMVGENKVTTGNTWNLALIDYFHDMSLLRNEGDQSINFQRASCTLDGCVKIWTSRVDSVGTETAKLASNLASGRTDDDDDEGSQNGDEDGPVPKKKKVHRSGATLAKDQASLQVKKLDLEFSVDPLFRKTCADFDEGGAHGLLMNHLNLGVGQESGLTVVFDAGDSTAKVEEEDESEDPEDLIDLSALRSQFMPDLSALEDKAISHSLEEFSFSKVPHSSEDDTALFQDDTRYDDDDDDDTGGPADYNMDVDGGDVQPAEDFFTGDNAINEDFGDGGDMMGGGGDFGDDDRFSPGEGGEPSGSGSGPFVPFDPRHAPKERDFILAMTDENAMDYFDKSFRRNWAGPEHWKLRRPIKKADGDGEKTTKRSREKKEAFKIDFLTPNDKTPSELAKELFAPAKGNASINLPGTGPTNGKKRGKKTTVKEKKDDHLLPDDMHFSSRQLVSLFLKPKFQLKMRGHRAQINDGDGEVDEDFWAKAAAEQAAAGQDGDGDDSAGGVPFNTQFFHDDFDDGPGFDDDGDGLGPAMDDEQDLLAEMQGQTSRRVRPETVKYARKAKRVDVRKLKENIWKNLDIVIAPPKTEEEMDVDEPDDLGATDPNEGREFSTVISGLQQSYPRDKMEDISTSFCFICLLHLANEQGLKLQRGDHDIETVPEDDEDGTKPVGNIWDVKIYRDPYATQAA